MEGFAASALASVMFSLMYIPVKYYPVFDGITFQWFLCSGVWISGFLVHWGSGYEGIDNYVLTQGVMGGSMWALSNYLLIPTMQMLGLGLGFACFNVVNLCVGYSIGRFGLFGTDQDPTSWVSDFGLFVLVASFVLMLQVKPDDEEEGEGEGFPAINQGEGFPAINHPGAHAKLYGAMDSKNTQGLEAHAHHRPKQDQETALGSGTANQSANKYTPIDRNTNTDTDSGKDKDADPSAATVAVAVQANRTTSAGAARGAQSKKSKHRRTLSTLIFQANTPIGCEYGDGSSDFDQMKTFTSQDLEAVRSKLERDEDSTTNTPLPPPPKRRPPSIPDDDRKNNFGDDASGSQGVGLGLGLGSGSTRLFGFVLAVVAGVLMGTNLLPFLLWQKANPLKDPWEFVMPQTTGSYFASTIIYLIAAGWAKLHKAKVPHSGIRPAFASGVIWTTGFALNLVALKLLGYSTGYTLGAVGPVMITSALSYFVFGEISNPTSVKYFAAALALQLVGVACVGGGRAGSEQPEY